MDLVSLLRTLGSLGTVLGILAGALWVVRRYDLRLPGRSFTPRDRRLELIETLPIDNRRMVALLRRDGHEHLVLVAPEGHLVLESGSMRNADDLAAADARKVARAEAARQGEASRSASAIVRLRKRLASTTGLFKVLTDRLGSPSGDQTQAPAGECFGALVDRASPRDEPAWLILPPETGSGYTPPPPPRWLVVCPSARAAPAWLVMPSQPDNLYRLPTAKPGMVDRPTRRAAPGWLVVPPPQVERALPVTRPATVRKPRAIRRETRVA